MRSAVLDKPVYRASGLYNCRKRLVAEKLAVPREPVPDWLETSAREGKRHEKWVLEDLANGMLDIPEYGKIKWGVKQVAVCPVCSAWLKDDREGIHCEIADDSLPFIIVCHYDADVSPITGTELQPVLTAEVKSMSQYEFDRWMKGKFEAFASYANQATVEFVGSRTNQLLYLVKNRSSGYIDKMLLTKPPANIIDILSRLTEVEDFCHAYADNHQQNLSAVFPEVWSEFYDPDSIDCRRCPYQIALGCVKVIDFTLGDAKALKEAEELWNLADEHESIAEEAKRKAKDIFKQATLAMKAEGRTWRFESLNINYHLVKASSYHVDRKEHWELKITKAKGQ